MRTKLALGGRVLAASVASALMLPLAGLGPASAVNNQITIASVRVPNVATYDTVGEVINFDVTVTNTGVNTLTDAYMMAKTGGNPDPNVTFSNPPGGGTCYTSASKLPTIAATESFTCRATYTVTQADLDRGVLSFLFYGYATTPVLNVLEQNIEPNLTADQNPAIELTKAPVPVDAKFSKAGDVVNYRLVATNTGNVTLSDVQISDPKLGTLTNCTPALGSTLEPKATMTCEGSYAVTQPEVDANKVDNVATTSGQPPTPAGGQKPARVTDDADATVPGTPNPAISLVKSANPERYVNVGDVITYTLVATNTGNLTLTDVVVTDPKLPALTCAPMMPATLAPSQQMTCTGSYTIVQADVEAGTVQNTARVTGQPPGGRPPVTDEDTAIVTGPSADMAITKSHTPASVIVGQDVTFTLNVRNNGPGTSYGVKVTDTLPSQLQYLSAGGPDWTCSYAAPIITCDYSKPFASGTSSQITVVTKAVSAGSQIVNVAVVDSKTPDPDPSNNRAEDVVGVTKDARVCPTDIVQKPGAVVIPGCRDVQIRVLCKVQKPSAAGQVSYCRVKQRKNGSVRVISKSQYPVRVKVVWFAPATDEYKAYRAVKRFTLKPNLPKV